MLEEYWPSTEEVEHCIRTEAEELAEHVLLAVHEPMLLIKRQPGETGGELVTEINLLDQLLKIERPIPIIGESGIGKSHLIRWLDAKLKVHPDAANWHIRRIPKNAGLRGVLELLLKGIEGTEFEQIRKRIATVGDQLSEKQVADYLIIGMAHRLEKLANDAELQLEQLRENGQRPDKETGDRIKLLERHAKSNKLPTLLNDPFFNRFLKDPDNGCIYQIAKRLTGQSKASDVTRNDYKINENELNFDLTLANLSLDARNYVSQALLNTHAERREEVTWLLNEIINDACRETFYHFFQFNSGSFQELFESIRIHLHTKGKTLVLLIEDMAAISAIEDVLIDSLITEGIRDGVEVRCPLRSAIAVTEGYIGYQRRRNTLATRAQYEWYLPNRSVDDQKTLNRIETFCGRYLNAARIGEKRLKETYESKCKDSPWPDIWHSEDSNNELLVSDFGKTEEGISLFPYNINAINALAKEYCTLHGELIFNPRTVLHHLLRNILLHYRESFDQRRFPPDQIGTIECPGQLASALSSEHVGNAEQIQTFAAVWGWGANSLPELANKVPAGVARAFHLEALANLLERKHSGEQQPDPRAPISPEPPSPVSPSPQPVLTIPTEVDEWFKRKDIPQKAANQIRTSLIGHIKRYGDASVRWWGVMGLPPLIRGKDKPLIHVAYNANNPGGNLVAYFGSDKEFLKETVRYKGVITAILRHDHYGSWSAYPEGYDDYCRYRAFLSKWVPRQVENMIKAERQAAVEAFCEHAGLAMTLEPRLEKMTHVERLSILSKTSKTLENEIESTGLDNWDILVNDTVTAWEEAQKKWLQWFSTKKGRAIEGDIVKPKPGGFKAEVPRHVRKVITSVSSELQKKYKLTLDLLKGCSTKDEFKETINALKSVIEEMQSEDQYKRMDGQWTSRVFLNRIKKLIEADHWSTVKGLLNIVEVGNNSFMIKEIRCDKLDQVDEILEMWSNLYDRNFFRIKDENLAAGAEKRYKKMAELKELWTDFAEQLGIRGDGESNERIS